jgi:putative ABC transport system permease protein
MIGKTINLNRRSFIVIGVSAAGFNGTEIGIPPDVLLPITARALMEAGPDLLRVRSTSWLDIIARRKPGVSLAQAQSSAGALFQAHHGE